MIFFFYSLSYFVLSFLPFQKLIENFQLQSQSIKAPLPLAELQSCMDMLQVSQQTVEGATWQQEFHQYSTASSVWSPVFYVTSVTVLFKKETLLVTSGCWGFLKLPPCSDFLQSVTAHTLQASDFCSPPVRWQQPFMNPSALLLRRRWKPESPASQK